jgi:hypothetical protein
MSKFQAKQEVKKLIQDVGRGAISTLFPNDFEYYMMSFDLKSEGKTIASLIFPVNPEQIRYNYQYNTTIKKTMSGVNVIINPTFNPFTITLSGTFGRGFKSLLSPNIGKLMNLQGSFLSTAVNRSFSTFAKTGYGCFKALEKMVSMCNQLDANNKPYTLIFTDLTINKSYFVEVKAFTPEMSVARNMIWYYSINMIAVGESTLSALNRAGKIGKKIAMTETTKVVNALKTQSTRNDLANTNFNI